MSEPYRPRLIDPILDQILGELPAVLIVGPHACGKTTTAMRRAHSVVQLDVPAQAAAFRADPDACLRGLPEPILIDEWQLAPESFGAVKRAVDTDSRAGRFLLTGSSYGDVEGATAAGTGRIARISLFGMTEREISGDPTEVSVIDRLAALGADGPSSRGGGIAVDDIRDYLGRALRSGFPEAASLEPEVARRLWLESYVTQITTRDVTGATGLRDPALLRRYLEAYALNSAGIVDAKTLYEAAGISKMTAARYERILENVFVTQSIPAWTSNRLKRLALSPKRYITDPGLLASILLLYEDAILRDASLLGRIIDTFVTAQLRAEATVARSRPRMFHLRQRDGGHKVDLVLELGGGGLIGIEVKAASTIDGHDARHLAWLRDQSGERFIVGIVLHTGPHAFPLGDRITAMPINALW